MVGQRIHFSNVHQGNSESIRFTDDPEYARLETARDANRIHRFLHLHFHPEVGLPRPSNHDLQVLNESVYRLGDRPLLSIGTIGNSGNGYILHLQRRFSGNINLRDSSLGHQLSENTALAASALNIDDVCQTIEIPGFIACDYTSFRCRTPGKPAAIEREPCFSRFEYSTNAPCRNTE